MVYFSSNILIFDKKRIFKFRISNVFNTFRTCDVPMNFFIHVFVKKIILFTLLRLKYTMYSMDSGSEDDHHNLQGLAFKLHQKEKEDEKTEKTKAVKGKKKGAVESKTNKEKASINKDWSDDEVSVLIDMLEASPCLWDVFHKDYTKRDVKEIAYTTIADALDTTIATVKAKINSLRAQLGRERAKETKTKSGQSTDELYSSSWIHYERFLSCFQ